MFHPKNVTIFVTCNETNEDLPESICCHRDIRDAGRDVGENDGLAVSV
jgi:hypothetical protein